MNIDIKILGAGCANCKRLYGEGERAIAQLAAPATLTKVEDIKEIMAYIGRTLTYVILGALLVASLLSVPGLSNFLQHYMNKVPGPVLIVVGMFLLDLLHLPALGGSDTSRLGERLGRSGAWGAGLLGMLFALSFCPTSAAHSSAV